jgi:hypothetical protein
MKKIYLMLVGLFTLATATAQITITAPPTAAYSYFDTFAYPVNFADYASFATPKTNATWDLTNVQYPNKVFFNRRFIDPSNNYPNAKFSKGISYIFAGGLSYDLRQHFDIDNIGVISLGEEVVVEQILSLEGLTGNSNDELVFPIQNIPYSNPQIERKLPLTMGSTYSSTKSQETAFNLTITSSGLNNTPGVRKTYRTSEDSVVGWGNVLILDIVTKAKYSVPVLQMRRKITIVDSFFLGGNPAPQQLLGAFGLKQGGEQYYYRVNFVSQGELGELVHLDFGSTPYQTVKVMEIQQNRMQQYATGLNKLSLQNAINVYPNPITNNTVTIDLPANQSGNYTYTLTDIFGRNIADGTIITNVVNLPDGLAKGNYILAISNNHTIVSINKVIK